MKKTLILLVCFLTTSLQAQDTIQWTNPSFESIPRPSYPPRGWEDANYFREESSPDTGPCQAFEVTQKAYHRSSYLGMVVRENETWEAVTQKLDRYLMQGEEYSFSVYLATSDTYLSMVRAKNTSLFEKQHNEKVNFNTPVVLKIWAGYHYGDKKQLLAMSTAIKNNDWKEYTFEFIPEDSYAFITFEAYYDLSTGFCYNGNLLMDNLSPIITVK